MLHFERLRIVQLRARKDSFVQVRFLNPLERLLLLLLQKDHRYIFGFEAILLECLFQTCEIYQ